MKKKYANGFVLGKFAPFHKGHEYLIQCAMKDCDHVYVCVDNIMDETISVKKRMSWVSMTFPEVTVVTQSHSLPQDPKETPDFWSIWRTELKAILPCHIDAVFSSEKYGDKLAEILESEHVMVDNARSHFNVSATELRDNILKNWYYLSDMAKYDYRKTICICGPESCGKSTLSNKLSLYYNVEMVEEYAKTVIEQKNRVLSYKDMLDILEGQHVLINDTIDASVNPFVVIDTDAMATKLWTKTLFDMDMPEAESYISKQEFDLYLLMYPDIPWVNDIHRFTPDTRMDFYEEYVAMLEKYNRNYVVINGTGDERINNAITAIERLFKRN